MLRMTSNLYPHVIAREVDDGKSNTNRFLAWRDDTLRQLDINYRWSPIVFDTRGTNGLDADDLKARAYIGYPGEDVRAGDRAPQIRLICARCSRLP